MIQFLLEQGADKTVTNSDGQVPFEVADKKVKSLLKPDVQDPVTEAEALAGLTVKELRKRLSARQLPTNGRKAELVARLEAAESVARGQHKGDKAQPTMGGGPQQAEDLPKADALTAAQDDAGIVANTSSVDSQGLLQPMQQAPRHSSDHVQSLQHAAGGAPRAGCQHQGASGL